MAGPSDSKHVYAPKDGSVTLTTQPNVTEKEIQDDRDIIIARLDSTYQNLTEAMAPFQAKWDAGWKTALAEATWEGASAGITEWGSDFTDYFKKETWVELGDKVEKAAGTACDTAAQYAANFYNEFRGRVNKAATKLADAPDHAGEMVQNYAWRVYEENVQKPTEQLIQSLKSTADSASESAAMAKKIYTHRDAIMNLPNLIAAGDPKPVQNFIDTALMDIDPELAKAIRNDPKFRVVLEIIADNESALSYLAYAGLALEAIPPNFYAYIAAKGGAYLLVEVVLLIITALLSAGTAAAARIATIGARFAMSGAKVAKIAKKVEHLQKAYNAFIRLIDDFMQAATDLHGLGEKLINARSRGVHLKGNTKGTLQAKREAIRRDKKCRICGSTKHTTPHGHFGTVKYE